MKWTQSTGQAPACEMSLYPTECTRYSAQSTSFSCILQSTDIFAVYRVLCTLYSALGIVTVVWVGDRQALIDSPGIRDKSVHCIILFFAAPISRD